MVVSSTTHPTLLDYTKRQDPDKSIATWRKLYGGVQPSKSETVQVTDSIGMMEAYAEVDKQLADLNGNTAAFRMSEDMAHIEGMNQELSKTLFYGDEGTDAEEFTGFRARFDNTSAAVGSNILSGANYGGDALSGNDNTSVWLVVWGPNTCHGIYAKGTQMGLSKDDKGQVTIEDTSGSGGGRMEAYRTHYKWCTGLSVRDWRYVVRMQVETADLTESVENLDLVEMMSDACELIPSLSMGRAAFYCNRKTKQYLRRQFVDKVKQSTLGMDEIGGRSTLTFDGIPIRKVDSIIETESPVS